jgi:hypothetical protein
VQIVLLDEARRRFEAEDDWWREHRDAKELFVSGISSRSLRSGGLARSAARAGTTHRSDPRGPGARGISLSWTGPVGRLIATKGGDHGG